MSLPDRINKAVDKGAGRLRNRNDRSSLKNYVSIGAIALDDAAKDFFFLSPG